DQFREGKLGGICQKLTRPGRRAAIWRAAEQLAADLALQLRYCAVNGGLCNTQTACSNGKVLGFCNGNQSPKLRGRGGQLKPWPEGGYSTVQAFQRAANAFGKLAGKGVREDALIAAVEECCAELAFKLFQRLRGGRLRDVAGAGGLGDRARFHHHYQQTQMTKIILNRQHGLRI